MLEGTNSPLQVPQCDNLPAAVVIRVTTKHKERSMEFFKKIRQVSYQHLIPDTILIVISLYASLYLRVGGTSDMNRFLPILHSYLPILVSIRLVVFIFSDIYLMMWRYVSTSDAVKILRAVFLSSVFILALAMLIPNAVHLPRSLFFIDSIVLTILLMGARLTRRLIYEQHHTGPTSSAKIKTLIIGAGGTGRLLSQRFLSSGKQDIDLLGFIDDDPKKLGKVIAKSKVLGSLIDLPRIIEEANVTQIIVAISTGSPELLKQIFEASRKFNIVPKITSHSSEVGQGSVDIFREIHIGDLLKRPSRNFDLGSIKELIKGKRVLITGAGGSIGSEISRQVLSHEPARLLLLDHSEYNLYRIDKELRLSTHDTTRVVPLLQDIKDFETLNYTLKEYAPEIVFHAAAYKHVHLVEANPFSSILNNIMGTHNLLEVCKDLKVSTFVNISSDKAVNPAGVMGASKRVSEILTSIAALKTGRQYCSVRFGNVLGSSGSLIPILTEQINSGSPITITHKDMTRYFMLIPEAVKLVLKAGTIARPGDINILKMGDPVKILDIANSLITLMGKSTKEVPILFTGLRPGEKMFEELYIRGDELRTEHPDILTIPNGDLSPIPNAIESSLILKQIGNMITHAQEGNKQALTDLSQLVRSTYIPENNSNDGDNHGVISNFINLKSNSGSENI